MVVLRPSVARMVCLPTGTMEGASCVLFYQSGRRSRHPRAPSTGKASTLSCEFLLFSRTNSRALGISFSSFWARRLAEVVAGFCLLLDLLASATSPSDAAHIAVQTDRLPRLSAMPRPQGDRWDCSSAEPILAPLGAERDSGQDQVNHVFSPADHRSQDTPGPRAGRNPGRARSARA